MPVGPVAKLLIDLHIDCVTEEPQTSVAKGEINAAGVLTLEPTNGSGIRREPVYDWKPGSEFVLRALDFVFRSLT